MSFTPRTQFWMVSLLIWAGALRGQQQPDLPQAPAAIEQRALEAAMNAAAFPSHGADAGTVTPASASKVTAPQSASSKRAVFNAPAGARAAANETETITGSTAELAQEHRLAIGDRLSFRILEDGDDPKELVVTDSGEVEVPYIGRIVAENKTCKQLTGEIKAALEKDYYYRATVKIAVDVMSKTHGRVYLVGAVRLPGPVELPGDETLSLSKAILRAGSFADFADQRHVKITRLSATDQKTKVILVVNVAAIFEEGKVELDLPLQSGDLIYVPEKLVRF